jgi:hypothetical protein
MDLLDMNADTSFSLAQSQQASMRDIPFATQQLNFAASNGEAEIFREISENSELKLSDFLAPQISC